MQVIKGNIFRTKCQTIVNTINCVGVMGAGLALEFRLRYPKMYKKYVQLCKNQQIKIGLLWLYKHSNKRWVLNFPTKEHWKFSSRSEYLKAGLQKFLATYKEKKILSVAFPLLGANQGGLSESLSLEIMRSYLRDCDIPVEIYQYDPFAYDDLYLKFKNLFLSLNIDTLSKETGLKKNYIKKIKFALEMPKIRSLSRLATIKGIGLNTLEKSFQYVMRQ